MGSQPTQDTGACSGSVVLPPSKGPWGGRLKGESVGRPSALPTPSHHRHTSKRWELTFFPFFIHVMRGLGSPVAWHTKEATPPDNPVWSSGTFMKTGLPGRDGDTSHHGTVTTGMASEAGGSHGSREKDLQRKHGHLTFMQRLVRARHCSESLTFFNSVKHMRWVL